MRTWRRNLRFSVKTFYMKFEYWRIWRSSFNTCGSLFDSCLLQDEKLLIQIYWICWFFFNWFILSSVRLRTVAEISRSSLRRDLQEWIIALKVKKSGILKNHQNQNQKISQESERYKFSPSHNENTTKFICIGKIYFIFCRGFLS
jgi:hypothetical protein